MTLCNSMTETIATVARVIEKCDSILFITGAGVSAESGVPTYRGIGGLYDVDVTDEGLPIEEILSGPMFDRNPQLTWKYLSQIAAASKDAHPNLAHETIAKFETRFDRVCVLTQNVDGFHRMAGSSNVIEIHGNMRSLSCTACSFQNAVTNELSFDRPPLCEHCQSIMRPNVVLFEEELPAEEVARLGKELEKGFCAIVSVGTSAMFPYIREPFISAHRFEAVAIEINPSETLLSKHADYRIAVGAVAAMERLWNHLAP